MPGIYPQGCVCLHQAPHIVLSFHQCKKAVPAMARSNESPMDFQWQQGFGPSGADSPFLKSVTSNQSQKPPLSAARSGNSRASVFPSTPSTKMPPQFRNPSFTTPQKSPDLDFSSGPENQSSPANGDTEDTPEPPARTELAKNSNAMVQFKAEKKQPALGIFGRYGMSGRGEIQRRPHNDVMARRIHKRKRREVDRDVRITRRRPSEDSEADDNDHEQHTGSGKVRPIPQEVHQVGMIPAFFSYLETHPNLPHVLSYYAQFLLNFFLVGVLIYMSTPSGPPSAPTSTRNQRKRLPRSWSRWPCAHEISKTTNAISPNREYPRWRAFAIAGRSACSEIRQWWGEQKSARIRLRKLSTISFSRFLSKRW